MIFRNHIPPKPKSAAKQREMLWDGVFNHIPTRLNWIDLQIKFIMLLIAAMIALIAVD
jgi:hypothetical protein